MMRTGRPQRNSLAIGRAIRQAVELLEGRRLLSTALYTADFEDGIGGASLDEMTLSPASGNLWHTSNLAYQSSATSLYYGQESTENYDTGVANSGSAVTPDITVTGLTSATLRLRSYLYTDAIEDVAKIEIATNGGTNWTEIATNAGDTPNLVDAPSWNLVSLDLSAYIGSGVNSIKLRFSFNTVDNTGNEYTGWFIDDVVVANPNGNPAPEITSITPTWGEVVTTSSPSIAVTFSEAVTDVDASDLVLGGVAGGPPASVTGVSMAGNVATFTLSGLTSGVLSASIAQTPGSIKDLSGQSVLPAVQKFIVLLPDRYEADDTAGTAKDLGRIGGTKLDSDLTLHSDTDEDWYKFTPDANGDVTVNISAIYQVGDVAVEAYGSDGTTLITSSDTQADTETITIPNAVAGQTYYIKVLSNLGDTTYDYDMTIAASLTPPKVTGVWAKGTGWSSNFLSFLGSQGLGDSSLGYAIPTGSANQLKTLPWINTNQISVRFSEGVMVTQGSLALTGINTPTYSASGFAYNDATFTATWTFASFAADRQTLTLNADAAGAIVDLAGIRLDGEFTNGGTALPSGNGTAGGNFVFSINLLPGDGDQSNLVDGIDLTAIRRRQLISAGGTGYSAFYDLDGSGTIDGVDLTAVRRRQLIGLP